MIVDAVSGRREVGVGDRQSGRGRTADRDGGQAPERVPAGPGLNDNGSGVAALLSVAERLAGRDLPLRFAFWGAEEIGLVGSRRYVDGLGAAGRRRIAAYLNLDMVRTPDSEPQVYDGGPVEETLRRHLPRGTDDVTLEDNSDHAPFEQAGIPVEASSPASATAPPALRHAAQPRPTSSRCRPRGRAQLVELASP